MSMCSDPLAKAFAEDLVILARNAKEAADYLATRMEEISPKQKHGAGRDVLRDWHAWLELSEIAASMSGGAK